MRRTIKIKRALFEDLLRRTTMYDIVSSISQQKDVFESGEKLVLLGSALASYEGHEYKDAMPIHRSPSDIDFYLYEPKGERGRFGFKITEENDPLKIKMIQSQKMEKALELAVANFDGKIYTKIFDDENIYFESEAIGNKKFIVSKPWTLDEIKERFNSPMVKSTLQRIMGNKQDDYEISNLDELYEEQHKSERNKHPHAIHCSVDVQMVAYPMSFLKPVKLAGNNKGLNEDGLVMGDDSLNTLALKLVRLVMPDSSNQLSDRSNPVEGTVGRARNMLDIHDILNIRKAKNLPPIDPKQLRVLFLAHFAYQKHSERELASLSHIADKEKMKHAFDAYIRYNIDHSRWGVIPDKIVDHIADEVLELMHAVFPNQDRSGKLNLSKNDVEFIQLANGYHAKQPKARSVRDKEKFYQFKHPHMAVERLAMAYPKTFEHFLSDDPEFKQRMATNWNLRPQHGGLDDAIMAGAVYPPRKEPHSR